MQKRERKRAVLIKVEVWRDEPSIQEWINLEDQVC